MANTMLGRGSQLIGVFGDLFSFLLPFGSQYMLTYQTYNSSSVVNRLPTNQPCGCSHFCLLLAKKTCVTVVDHKKLELRMTSLMAFCD